MIADARSRVGEKIDRKQRSRVLRLGECMRWQWFVAITMALGTVAVGQQKFPMTCHPFKAIEMRHPIDGTCGLTGKGQGGSALQNQAMVAALPGYQQWSGENMPASRSGFVALGEGTAVQFVGYVLEAHYADLSSGEGVNCDVKDDEASNDIHIALVPQSTTTDECQSNSAEMTPHYRPASWTKTNLDK